MLEQDRFGLMPLPDPRRDGRSVNPALSKSSEQDSRYLMEAKRFHKERSRSRDRKTRRFRMGVVGWVVAAIVVVAALWAIMTYNGLVSLRQRCRQAFSDIDVQLKQRHDLVPNLVETVKGYASHEKGTLEAVIKARNAAVSAQGPAAQAAAEGMLQGALRQIFALSEAYPDLKA